MSDSIFVTKEVCASISAANPLYCSFCTAAGQVMIAYSDSNEWTLQGEGYIDLCINQNQNLFINLYSSETYESLFQFQLYTNFFKHYKKVSDTFYSFDSNLDYTIGLSFSSAEEAKNFNTAVINLSKQYCKKKLFTKNSKDSDKSLMDATSPYEIESPLEASLFARGYTKEDLRTGKIDRHTIMEILVEAEKHSNNADADFPVPQSLPPNRSILNTPDIVPPSIFTLNPPPAGSPPSKSPLLSPIFPNSIDIQSSKSAPIDKVQASSLPDYTDSPIISPSSSSGITSLIASNLTENTTNDPPPNNSSIDKSPINIFPKKTPAKTPNTAPPKDSPNKPPQTIPTDIFKPSPVTNKFLANNQNTKPSNDNQTSKVTNNDIPTNIFKPSPVTNKFLSNNANKNDPQNMSSNPMHTTFSNETPIKKPPRSAPPIEALPESAPSKLFIMNAVTKKFLSNSNDSFSKDTSDIKTINKPLTSPKATPATNTQVNKEIPTKKAPQSSPVAKPSENNDFVSLPNIYSTPKESNNTKKGGLADRIKFFNSFDVEANNDIISENINMSLLNENQPNSHVQNENSDNNESNNSNQNENEVYDDNNNNNEENYNKQTTNQTESQVENKNTSPSSKPSQEFTSRNRCQRGRANSTVVVHSGKFFINNFQVKPPPKVKPPPPDTPPPLTARRIPKIDMSKGDKNYPLPMKISPLISSNE